ncbi:hypothetical protein [Priestia megaterium]|uniref:hypothetical protein n=1 Tax=Priestia megaterium TaxID=1404 RepID=UPI0031FD0E7B
MNEKRMKELQEKIIEGNKAKKELNKAILEETMSELTKRAEEGSPIHVKLLAKIQGQEVKA